MPDHRLILCSSLARLESALFEDVAEQKKGDNWFAPVVVLCGSKLLGHYLRRELARRGASSACLSFPTIDELAGLLAGRAILENGRAPLPPQGRKFILRKLARTHDLKYFREAREQVHFAQTMAETLRDIEDSGIDFAKASVSCKGKISEIGNLYAGYRRELGKQLFAEADLLALAAERAETFPELFGTSRLFVYGFYEMTGAQRGLLSQLARSVTLDAFLLSDANGSPRYAASQPLRAWWRSQGLVEQEAEPQVSGGDLARLRRDIFAWDSRHLAARVAQSSVGTAAETPQKKAGTTKTLRQLPLFESNCSPAHSASAENASPADAVRSTAENVLIFSCPHEVSEVREIAREAIRLKQHDGVSFIDMAVLARDGDTYLPLLAAIFEQTGIPFYIREGLSIDRSAVGRSILGALSLPESNFARSEVMQWLTIGALDRRKLNPAEGNSIQPAPVALWDRISAEAGVIEGEEQWKERIQAWINEEKIHEKKKKSSKAETAQPDEPKDDFQFEAPESPSTSGTEPPEEVEPSAAGSSETPAPESISCTQSPPTSTPFRIQAAENLLAFLANLFGELQHLTKLTTWADLADATSAFVRQYHSPCRERELVEEAIYELRQLDLVSNCAITLEDFAAAAETAIAGLSSKLGKLQQTGIHLLSLSQARHTRFRVVFVPGLAERSFPIVGRQDPILLDHERESLSAGQSPGLPLKGLRPQEEKLLFILALEAAREKLVLTMPRTEAASGKERVPSHFLLNALGSMACRTVSHREVMLRESPTGVGLDLPWLSYVPNSSLLSQDRQSAVDDREFDLGGIRGALASAHPEAARYLEDLHSNFARAVEAERALWGTDRLTTYEGMLVTPACLKILQKIFDKDHSYSATALETYAKCPYEFFLKQVLWLEPLEDPAAADEISALDRGSLVHGILEDFYKEMQRCKQLPLAKKRVEFYRQKLAAACDARFCEMEALGLAGLAGTWSQQRQFIREDLERFLLAEINEGEDGEDWTPQEFELDYGSKGRPPDTLSIGELSLKTSGKIDRIDFRASGTAARVIDYKSGRNYVGNEANLDGGRALQLPLYLYAARQLFPKIQLGDSRAEYRFLTRRGGWKTVGLEGKQLQSSERNLETILTTILEGCRGGVFPRLEEDRGTDFTGELDTIGDPRRKRLWERKRNDCRLSALLKMRQIT